LAGNRKQRTVSVNEQTLVTDYVYDTDTDRLLKETHTGPVYAFVQGGERYYAYANPSGGVHYQRSAGDKPINQFTAFWLGLPSVWNSVLFYAVIFLIPVLAFWPVLMRQWSRIRGSADPLDAPDLKLWHRVLCVLLAYIFLIGPEVFHTLAQAQTQYANLNSASWGQGNRDIHYYYDANGSLTEKVTAIKDEPNPQTNYEEKTTYTYNLQNRLAQIVREYDDAGDTIEEFTAYAYNDDGIRVSKHTWSEINDTHQNDDVTIVYLVDVYNHTGYAQVLEEMTFNNAVPDPLTDTPDSLTTYTIGDDVIAQTVDGATEYLLYDGHGSTRQLAEYDSGTGTVSIQDSYSYDGYGVMLQEDTVASANPGRTLPQAANLLYAGEQFDTDAQQYYLRARYYNPANGLFNKVDPYSGNRHDPQSLHKYLYAHSNPVNNIDPTGQFIGTIADAIDCVAIRGLMLWMQYGAGILNALTMTAVVTGLLFVMSSLSILLMDWGYLPQNLRSYAEAIRLYSGIGFVLSLTALSLLSTLPDPRQTARPPQPGPRLDRDKAVDGRPAPEPKLTSRPVAQNPHINAEKNRDVLRLRQQGALQVKIDQRQTQYLGDSSYVQKGLNRPDTQGIFKNKPAVHIEYDTRINQLMIRRDRILANDPDANVILKLFDTNGNYTIVP